MDLAIRRTDPPGEGTLTLVGVEKGEALTQS